VTETLVYLIFFVSLMLTVWHLAEEHQGRLWQYFGAISGVQVADGVGRFFFTILLGMTLVIAAFGILGIYRISGARSDDAGLSLVGVGFLIGGRVSDWWNSHFSKRRIYKWDQVFLQNPGFLSSWFYLADVALLIYFLRTFKTKWIESWPFGLVGLLAGSGLFFIVIPVITWIGKKFYPQSVRPPWMPNQPIPNWVTK
jgi:hypothetical protein